MYRRVGYRYEEGRTLVHIGDVHHEAGRQADAVKAWHGSLAILDQLGDPLADIVRVKTLTG